MTHILFNHWLIIKLVIAVFTGALVFYVITKKVKKYKLRKRVLADNKNDYSDTARNIALSISRAKLLYKELIVKVHPDKFSGNDAEQANILSAKITESKRDYNALQSLRQEVVDFLRNKQL